MKSGANFRGIAREFRVGRFLKFYKLENQHPSCSGVVRQDASDQQPSHVNSVY